MWIVDLEALLGAIAGDSLGGILRAVTPPGGRCLLHDVVLVVRLQGVHHVCHVICGLLLLPRSTILVQLWWHHGHWIKLNRHLVQMLLVVWGM